MSCVTKRTEQTLPLVYLIQVLQHSFNFITRHLHIITFIYYLFTSEFDSSGSSPYASTPGFRNSITDPQSWVCASCSVMNLWRNIMNEHTNSSSNYTNTIYMQGTYHSDCGRVLRRAGRYTLVLNDLTSRREATKWIVNVKWWLSLITFALAMHYVVVVSLQRLAEVYMTECPIWQHCLMRHRNSHEPLYMDSLYAI